MISRAVNIRRLSGKASPLLENASDSQIHSAYSIHFAGRFFILLNKIWDSRLVTVAKVTCSVYQIVKDQLRGADGGRLSQTSRALNTKMRRLPGFLRFPTVSHQKSRAVGKFPTAPFSMLPFRLEVVTEGELHDTRIVACPGITAEVGRRT